MLIALHFGICISMYISLHVVLVSLTVLACALCFVLCLLSLFYVLHLACHFLAYLVLNVLHFKLLMTIARRTSIYTFFFYIHFPFCSFPCNLLGPRISPRVCFFAFLESRCWFLSFITLCLEFGKWWETSSGFHVNVPLNAFCPRPKVPKRSHVGTFVLDLLWTISRS